MEAFAALADNTRRQIVHMLAQQGELSASEICKQFSMSAPAVSQHLKVLREARIVQMKKQAQKRLYSIETSGINEISDWLADLKKLWNDRFDALDDYLLELKSKEQNS